MVKLLEVAEMPPIADFAQPRDLYSVIDDPAPLAGMPYPSGPQWRSLHNARFRWIVCLTEENPPYSPDPLQMLFATRLRDLLSGGDPPDPSHEEAMIRKAVGAIVPRLLRGDGVIVHCEGGRGRAGTVLGCALIELGAAPTTVIEYLDRIHKARGTPGWPEANWQADLVRRFS